MQTRVESRKTVVIHSRLVKEGLFFQRLVGRLVYVSFHSSRCYPGIRAGNFDTQYYTTNLLCILVVANELYVFTTYKLMMCFFLLPGFHQTVSISAHTRWRPITSPL